MIYMLASELRASHIVFKQSVAANGLSYDVYSIEGQGAAIAVAYDQEGFLVDQAIYKSGPKNVCALREEPDGPLMEKELYEVAILEALEGTDRFIERSLVDRAALAVEEAPLGCPA